MRAGLGRLSLAEIAYQRCRFTTQLPTDRSYTAGHYWLREIEPVVWRVGLTKWALRMLGDLVEYSFEAKPGAVVKVGQIVGWLEAFKAVADLYAVAEGTFVGVNPALDANLDVISQDCYGNGWLYTVKGKPDADSVDAPGYVRVLDATIDEVRGIGNE